MSTTALAPTHAAVLPRYEPTSEFVLRCDEAMANAAIIARVSNPEENAVAVAALGGLMSCTRDIEATRKRLKEPILDLGRSLDAAARKLALPLEQAAARVQRIISDYQDAERQRERERLQEIERARAEELRKAEALEASKRAEAVKAAEERAAIDRQIAAAPRAAGQTVREEWEINVTNIWDLARAHPACVKIEARLSEIKQLLDLGHQVTGVSAKRVTRVGVRTTTIEV